MKFSVEVGSLRDAVAHAQVTTDTALPIYQGLYLKASQTDTGGKLEVFSMKPGSKALFTIPATVLEAGSQVVRGEQLLSGLRGQKNSELVTLTYSTKLNRLCGVCAGSRFTLAILDGQQQLSTNLNLLPVDSTSGSIYDAALLRGVVKRAAWCAHRDASGAITVDALDFKSTPEGYKVLATDGYIAVRVEVRTDHESTDRVILKESLETLSKFLSLEPDAQVRVISGEPVDGLVRETFFRAPGFFYGANVCDVKMPAIETIFSQPGFQPQREVLITRSVLVSTLGRIAGFVEKAAPSVKLSLRGSVLTLSTASEEGDCVEKLDVAYSDHSKLKESDDVTVVYVSSKFLAKILTSVESEVLMLGLRNAMSPLIVSDEHNDEINTRYVVMTVRGNFEAKDEETVEVAVVVPAPVGEVLSVADDTSFLDDLRDEDEDEIPVLDDEEDEILAELEEGHDRSTSDELPVGSV